MNQRVVIPLKVRRIMPLMGSPMDGEALGACRAVGRVLTHVGLTFRDLAQAIPTAPPCEAAPSLGAVPAYRPNRRKVFTFTPAQTANHRRMALWLRNNEYGRLSAREREFVANVASWRCELSIPQADWLTDLVARIEEDRTAWQ